MPFTSPSQSLPHDGYWGDPDDFEGFANAPRSPLFRPFGEGGRRRSDRRRLVFVVCLLVVLGLHACLLLLWRNLTPPRLDAIGKDAGGGGISLSLVSGVAGAKFASLTGAHAADATHADQAAAADPADPTSQTSAATGEAGAEATVVGDGHDSGGAAGTAQAGPKSTTGSGVDPSSYPSFAPLSFEHVSEPGLFEQVQRCMKSYPPTETVFLLILNDAGELVGVAPQPTGQLNMVGNDPQALRDTLGAVQACSPYHDIKGGLSKPLTLVVPADGPPAATPIAAAPS